MTKREIAACIDHTFLKAAGDPDAVERLCAEAKKYHFACAMVNPAEVKRLWQGPKDHSGKVWLSKDTRGLRIRVEVEDDVHCQPYTGTEQHKGDAVQIAIAVPGRLEPWVFALAHRDDGGADVVCRIAPKGFDAQATAARIRLRTSREGTITRYEALLPYGERAGFVEQTLEDGIRFNLMITDNDGDGCDATIEIVPNTFRAKDISRAPIIRFGRSATVQKAENENR